MTKVAPDWFSNPKFADLVVLIRTADTTSATVVAIIVVVEVNRNLGLLVAGFLFSDAHPVALYIAWMVTLNLRC